MKERVLLFIPMYNCEKQIVRVLGQLSAEVLQYVDQVMLINNRSIDNGEAAAISYCEAHPELPVKIFRNNENYGLGGSHKVAFRYALENKFDYVIVLHGDDQGCINDILPYLKNGEAYKYDSFLGSRFEKNSKLINYSAFRIFGNRVFNLFMTLVLGKKVTDLGSGLNMYKVDYLRSEFYRGFINSLTFNVYMLMYGVFSKSNFKFFPLEWREDDQVSNAKFLKQSREILKIACGYIFHPARTFETAETEWEGISYTSQIVFENAGNKQKQE